jgi:hypothetical protein
VNASSEHRPWLNQPGPWHDAEFGSKGRLKAVIGLDAFPLANGPALHETLHHWGVFVDAKFGFGVGNLITLPGLIVQQELPRRDFARAVSLNVAITQLVAATGPSILGVLHELSGTTAP